MPTYYKAIYTDAIVDLFMEWLSNADNCIANFSNQYEEDIKVLYLGAEERLELINISLDLKNDIRKYIQEYKDGKNDSIYCCPATTFDWLTNHDTQCMLAFGHEGQHDDGCLSWCEEEDIDKDGICKRCHRVEEVLE